MDYETWIAVRAEFALLFEELALSERVGFPRDFSQIFTRPYHEFLDPGIGRDGLATGSLLMILCMALDDIESHQCVYDVVYSDECRGAVSAFVPKDRTMKRLWETTDLALTIIAESDFHGRREHRKYGHLVSMLAWVRDDVVLGHFRDILQAADSAATQ
jgi:hypothetical protein